MASLAVRVDEGQKAQPLISEGCQNCGSTDRKLQLCAQCHFAKYCGRECQAAHWPKHKTACAERSFWRKVEAVPTMAKEGGPIAIQGKVMFPSLAEAQRDMALHCTRPSEYVHTYLIASDLKGTILDLGCGVGVNSIPLYRKGWQVTAIDKQPGVIAAYSNQIAQSPRPHVVLGDITEVRYPENLDAIIAVDILPYVPPARLKGTMEKIYQALRSGGTLVGTLFFKGHADQSPFTELMGKLGAHFYPSKEMAREIITRSGFRIEREDERIDGPPTGNDAIPRCLEFLAKKPSPS